MKCLHWVNMDKATKKICPSYTRYLQILITKSHINYSSG